jgi:hypothetical protein
MYFILKMELRRHGIKQCHAARTIKSSEHGFSHKINGLSDFRMQECRTLRDTYFPEYSLDYLFTREIAQ